MGPPGSGKGTQAQLLVDRAGWLQLSTGEIFRKHGKEGTKLGRLARSYMDRGQYVPDEVTVDMVRERLRELTRETRILFDGFPRTVAQAEALDKLLAEFDRHVGAVLVLDVPREELAKRLRRRGELESRADDTPEVIATRYDVYIQQTAPVVEHYERNGLVKRIDGRGAVEDVAARMAAALADPTSDSGAAA